MLLYSYAHSLIVQEGSRFGEIAPLPGFSKETYAEAKAEIIDVIRFGKTATLPSVKWGLSCLNRDLHSIQIATAARAPRENFPFYKVKLGEHSLDDAIALVKSLISKYRLRLDFNRKWPLKKIQKFTENFHKDDFDYLEEPTYDLLEFETEFPIALDESLLTIDYTKVPTLKAIVIKPTVVGYIPQIPSNVKLILSSSHETGLGLLHIAHLAKELKLSDPMGLDTPPKDLLYSPIHYASGHFIWEETHPPVCMDKLCPIAL